MLVKVYKSLYKDQTAVTLESSFLKVQFLPELGGKMSSFFDKKSSREFLVQREGKEYKTLTYDGNYIESECSGFDDMFPTIDKVYYSDYPWKGIEIPDHGEVCGLKWDYEICENCLYMLIYGVRFPYKLEKWIRFYSDHTLNIKYKATNLSNFDMDFIWAAHPMINVEEGGEILIPYRGRQYATCMFSSDEKLGRYGDLISWPGTVRTDGSIQELNLINSLNENRISYKYYFKDKVPDGWCALRYKSDGTRLKLSYPEDKVPYLGIWVNEGIFKGYNNIAFEPCTGSFDRPDIAKEHRQNSVLSAKGEYCWYLNFNVEYD